MTLHDPAFARANAQSGKRDFARSRAPAAAGARFAIAATVLLLLAACGKQQALRPAAGMALPPKPATSPVQPQPADLLAPRTEFRPGRSDELLTKSQTRADDKFDLPPQ